MLTGAPAQVLEAWAKAFNASDLPAICALYAPQALLWGTTAPSLIRDPAGIEGYFRAVFGIQPAPQAQVTECTVRAYGDFAVLAGAYDLLLVADGQRLVQPARFTFGLWRSPAGWRIVEHHSSRLPSEPLLPALARATE